jgi:hypothetical protein
MTIQESSILIFPKYEMKLNLFLYEEYSVTAGNYNIAGGDINLLMRWEFI